jgi:hypothetical protein
MRWAMTLRTAVAISLMVAVTGAVRPPLYHIKLEPQNNWAAGSGGGAADLFLAPSPFDVTLTPDGHVLYDITVSAAGLPAPSSAGATHYVAWVATADLTDAQLIGVLDASGKASGHVSYNKFIVVVSAEHGPPAKHWAGPIVMSGFSPSTYLENYSGKELYNGGTPQ